jgi:hypothetical protein
VKSEAKERKNGDIFKNLHFGSVIISLSANTLEDSEQRSWQQAVMIST